MKRTCAMLLSAGGLALSLALSAGTAAAAELVAQWRSFDGLTAEKPLPPCAGLTLRENRAETWDFHLNGGSVSNGVLSTGTGAAPAILFNGMPYEMAGYTGHKGYTIIIRAHQAETFTANKPIWELGNTIGICLSASNAMRGIWNNDLWNNNAFPAKTFTWSNEPAATVMAFVGKGKESTPAMVLYVNGEHLTPDPTGLQSAGFTAQAFYFGNYSGATSGGIDFRIDSVAVYNGAVAQADITNLPLGTLAWKGGPGDSWTNAASWEGLENVAAYDASHEILFPPSASGDVCTVRVDTAVSASHAYVTGGKYAFSGTNTLSPASLTLSRGASLTLDAPLETAGIVLLRNGSVLKTDTPFAAQQLALVGGSALELAPAAGACASCTQAPSFSAGSKIRCTGAAGLTNGVYTLMTWEEGALESLPALETPGLETEKHAALAVGDGPRLALVISDRYVWNGGESAAWNTENAWLFNNASATYPGDAPTVFAGQGTRDVAVGATNRVSEMELTADAGAYTFTGSGAGFLDIGSLLAGGTSSAALAVPFAVSNAVIAPGAAVRFAAAGRVERIENGGAVTAAAGATLAAGTIAGAGTVALESGVTLTAETITGARTVSVAPNATLTAGTITGARTVSMASNATLTAGKITGARTVSAASGAAVTITCWDRGDEADPPAALDIETGARVVISNSLPGALSPLSSGFKPTLSGGGHLTFANNTGPNPQRRFLMKECSFSGTVEIASTLLNAYTVFGDVGAGTPFAGRPDLFNNGPARDNPAIILGPDCASNPLKIGNLYGRGFFRSDWGGPPEGDVRTIDARLTRDCEYSGKFLLAYGYRKLRLVVGAAAPGLTMTLSGDNTSAGELVATNGATVALPAGGGWDGPVTVAEGAALAVSRLTGAMRASAFQPKSAKEPKKGITSYNALTLNGTLRLEVSADGELPRLDVYELAVGPAGAVEVAGRPADILSCAFTYTADAAPERLPALPPRYHWKLDEAAKQVKLVREQGTCIIVR